MARNKELLEEQKKLDNEGIGEPESFTFDPIEHVYTLDGKRLYGVTTILGVIAKPMLIQWAANMAVDYIKAHEVIGHYNMATKVGSIEFDMAFDDLLKQAKVAHRKKKEDAGKKGTDVHQSIENIIKIAIEKYDGVISEAEDIIENGAPQLSNFIKWAQDNKVKFLASEKRMFSRRMWVAGTADIVCEINGKRYVGDVKTSSGIYPEHFIQASAYASMLKEMGEPEFHGVIIINLKKDGGFEVKENYDIEGNLKAFESALTLFTTLESLK